MGAWRVSSTVSSRVRGDAVMTLEPIRYAPPSCPAGLLALVRIDGADLGFQRVRLLLRRVAVVVAVDGLTYIIPRELGGKAVPVADRAHDVVDLLVRLR